MSEDYLAYWGMTKPPFSLTPDPEMLYLSAQHSECLMRLKYAIFSHKGGALLVSDTAGNGKTSILVRLQNDLRDYYSGLVKIAFIDHPTLTPIEMLGEIARQLGGELHTTEKIRALNFLRDRLFSLYNENVKVVVIVDEGQMLKERPDILGELRILLNFCVSEAFLLTFIFSGQKPLDSVLRDMPEFWQRLPVRFFLKNLDFEETRSLLRYRLDKAGASEEIFTQDAYEGIFHYSGGCPRIICSVADLCLLIGYAKHSRRIGFVEISTACRDMEASGDSFHYYTYIKTREGEVPRKPEPEPGPADPPRAKHSIPSFKTAPASAPKRTAEPKPASASKPAPSPETVPAPYPTPSFENLSCPRCAQENPEGTEFCGKCGQPLAEKCPSCGMISVGSDGQCTSCGTDLPSGRTAMVDELRREMLPFDILEGHESVWLDTEGFRIENDERVIAAFPRGSLFTPGPSLVTSLQSGGERNEPCDLVLTDRKLILSSKGEPVSTEFERFETCFVSQSGGAHLLIVGSKSGMSTIRFPGKLGRNRPAIEHIASFIRSSMLK